MKKYGLKLFIFGLFFGTIATSLKPNWKKATPPPFKLKKMNLKEEKKKIENQMSTLLNKWHPELNNIDEYLKLRAKRLFIKGGLGIPTDESLDEDGKYMNSYLVCKGIFKPSHIYSHCFLKKWKHLPRGARKFFDVIDDTYEYGQSSWSRRGISKTDKNELNSFY